MKERVHSGVVAESLRGEQAEPEEKWLKKKNQKTEATDLPAM